MKDYKFKRVTEHGYIITEDGHTMFPEDVVHRFERLNYLEEERLKPKVSMGDPSLSCVGCLNLIQDHETKDLDIICKDSHIFPEGGTCSFKIVAPCEELPGSKIDEKSKCLSFAERHKPLTLKGLKHFVDQGIKYGYEDSVVYFDTEAKTFDCHIVPIKTVSFVSEEVAGEKIVILHEYIPLPEEPLIVHNVMSYKGKNYLKHIGSNCASCSIHNELCIKLPCQNGENIIWKSFEDIQITDELACMRKDIGDVYLKHRTSNTIFRFTHVVQNNRNPLYNGCIEYNSGMLMPIAFDLATAEELQVYFNEDSKTAVNENMTKQHTNKESKIRCYGCARSRVHLLYAVVIP